MSVTARRLQEVDLDVPPLPRLRSADVTARVEADSENLPQQVTDLAYLHLLLLHSGEQLPLRQVLKLEVLVRPGEMEVFAPAICLAGVGVTLLDAIQDLSDTAVALWEEFSQTPAPRLDVSAREALDRLRRYIA